MKKYLIFLLLFLIYYNSNSQTEHPNDAGQLIRIPVVFHIVSKFPQEANFTRKKLETIIELTNKGFNNVNKDKIIKEYRNDIATCNIELYIPDKAIDENGTKRPAISYHKTNRVFKSRADSLDPYTFQLSYDRVLKSKGYVNSKKYLNIWIANLDGKSYSTMPQEKNKKNDGIVLHYKEFDFSKLHNSQDKLIYASMVINHEVGHWLGLWHIWGKTTIKGVGNCICSPLVPYSYCDDDIKDTPKQKKSNVFNFYGKNDSLMLKTCSIPKSTALISNYQNFMDYSYNVGMFTEEQKMKMRYNIFEYRSELLASFSSYNLKKIAINNQYSDKLEFTITSLDGSNYKSTFHNNYKNIVKGRYLFQINDYKTKKGIANNTFVIKDKGIIIVINKYGCTKWKYIGDERLYDFSFNINKLEGKCNNYSNTSSRNTRNTRYKSRKRKSNNSKRRKSSGNKSYDDAYKRAQKMYDKGYKRANDMYNKAKKKHR